tara:strand:+ start:41 stop:661 length:621 start_codon:yes stop_codon:yes gene_type:complete
MAVFKEEFLNEIKKELPKTSVPFDWEYAVKGGFGYDNNKLKSVYLYGSSGRPLITAKFNQKESGWEFEKIYIKKEGYSIEKSYDKDSNVVAKYLNFPAYKGNPNVLVNMEDENKDRIISILEKQIDLQKRLESGKVFYWQIEKNGEEVETPYVFTEQPLSCNNKNIETPLLITQDLDIEKCMWFYKGKINEDNIETQNVEYIILNN